MTDKGPVGKMATLHWQKLTEMAREARETEAAQMVDAYNADPATPHKMDWRWGYRGIQFTITKQGKSKP